MITNLIVKVYYSIQFPKRDFIAHLSHDRFEENSYLQFHTLAGLFIDWFLLA